MVKNSTLQRKRQFWSDEEDSRLVGLVEVHGIHSWPEVAAGLRGRDSKSCSLRWRYFLAPHIIRTTDQKMTDWEVAVLFWAQRQYGNKWRTIVDEYLPWRSPNDLKNYCNQYILGKGSHVVAQNKLLLQGVSMQVLLSHQPPEVVERWKKVKQMQQQSAPQNEQRPVKKGTRGLSYIIRQAAKLQSQRFQPYPQSSGGPSAAAAGSAAAAADGEASPAGTSATSRKKRHSSPLGETGAGGFQGAQAQGSFLNPATPQHQYFAPQPAASAAGAAYPGMSGAAAAAAAAAAQGCPLPIGLQQQQQQAAGATTAGFSASCAAMQQYGGPASQSPSGTAGASLLPFAPPAGSFSSSNSNSSRTFSHSPGQYSSGIPAFQQQQQQQGTVGGPFMGQGSFSCCLPPPGTSAGSAAAAAAGGVGGVSAAMQGALPASWTPLELNIAPYGHSSGLPLGPPSNSSCFTPSSGMNMNMATPSSTAMDMNMGTCFPIQGTSGPGCSYLTAAGGAAGGAFGYQGPPQCSFSCPPPPQGLQQSAGSFSGWSTLEGPCFTSGNSSSSNSSSSFSLDPGGLHSPTNQSCSRPYLPPAAQQQQGAAAAYSTTMQSGHQQLLLLVNTGYQLLPPLQQQLQPVNPVCTYQPGSAHSTPPKQQQQQQQWPSQEPPARYSGTGATSDDDLSLLLGMEAGADDDIDPADIAELLGSDSGEELESIFNASAPAAAAANAAAAAAAVVVGSEFKQQEAACFSSCPESKAAVAAAVAAATGALQLQETLNPAPAAAAAAGKDELQYQYCTTASGDLDATIDVPSAAGGPDGASVGGADIDSDVDLELLLELTAEDSLSDMEPFQLEEHPDDFEAVMLAAGW